MHDEAGIFMTKIIGIFIFYFVAMSSLIVYLDLLVGIPLNTSIPHILNPFAVTDKGERAFLFIFLIAALLVPLKHYFKHLVSIFSSN